MKNFTKSIMITSGILNGILGIAFTFLPQEAGAFLGTAVQTGPDVLITQFLGAALVGLAMINYMSRGAVLGGIYGKPILLGNLVFHLATGLTLIKYLFNTGQWELVLFIPALLYLLLTAGFIKLNFTSPV